MFSRKRSTTKILIKALCCSVWKCAVEATREKSIALIDKLVCLFCYYAAWISLQRAALQVLT